MRWVFIGFACTFVLKDIEQKYFQNSLHIKASAAIAISLALLLLSLFIFGFDTTIAYTLSLGVGIIMHLGFFSLTAFVTRFFSIPKTKQQTLHL